MKMKFIRLFCIIMSFLAMTACSENNQNNDEPQIPGGGDGGEGTVTYWETTYSDLSALIDQDIDQVWSAAPEIAADKENNLLYVQDQKGNQYKATIEVDGTTVSTIEMVPAGKSVGQESAVWTSLVSSFRDFKLGTFLGTKFKDYTSGEGGIKQTTEETLPLLTSEANMLIFPIFGIQKTVYCCPVMDKDQFRVELCRNYLSLDFSTLGRYVGENIDEVLQEYYAIGNKILFGTAMSYIYFDSALDHKGNSYTAYFDSDKTLETILEISVYVPEDDQTITRWKDMLQNYESYNLGTLEEIYVTDAFGDKVQDLADAQAAFDLYETNGRNNGIIARFTTAYGTNSFILNKDYCYVILRK